MKEQRILTEQPEEELWRSLLHFSYPANIEKYLLDKSLDANNALVECVSGCFLQAHEYFQAASKANLQISPLLLYYGATNLLYGITNLFTGTINKIENHGMKVNLNENYSFIAETEVHFVNYSKGGIHVFCRGLNLPFNLTDYGVWTVQELLGSIAEVSSDYRRCYKNAESYVIPIDETQTENGIVEKVYLREFDENSFSRMFSQVPNAKKSYLPPQIGYQADGDKYIILRHKINGKAIIEKSYSEQPYLQVGHNKNGKNIALPALLYMYIILFAFSSLCRYKPEKWNPFVRNDSTGERLLVEKFMYYARRTIPNIVLNHLYDCRMIFINEKYHLDSVVKVMGEHAIKELVRREVASQKGIGG